MKAGDTSTTNVVAAERRPGVDCLEEAGDDLSSVRGEGSPELRRYQRSLGVLSELPQQAADWRGWILGERLRQKLRHGQPRLDQSREGRRDAFGIGLTLVQQNNHGEIKVGIALECGVEAAPGTAVSDPPVSSLLEDVPAQTVRIGAAVVEPDRSPAELESLGAERLRVVEPSGELGQVARAEAEA